MYTPRPDVLELAGRTFGMCLIKIDGKYWYGHKISAESFNDCQTKFGPCNSLKESVKNLNVYLKTYGGNAELLPACFDDQGNPQNPDSEKSCKDQDW
ncbi:MAG: hypothetical protein JW920_02055 [Deltaproteobacteria bacterium]|nr:hypothetical protein [Deltaproteobacteria bacterium]